MAYMNYKEGTGVRARSDLSANAQVGDEPARLTTKELAAMAEILLGLARQAERKKKNVVEIPLRTVRRLGDSLLEVVNREERP